VLEDRIPVLGICLGMQMLTRDSQEGERPGFGWLEAESREHPQPKSLREDGIAHNAVWQGSPEYYDLVHEHDYSYLQIWRDVIYGPAWERHDPTSVDGDAWWTRRALRSIKDEPDTYLRFAVEKAGTYWLGDPLADWGQSHLFDYRRLRSLGWTRADALGAMFARFLPVLALIAVAVLWRRRRTLLPIYAVLLYATLLAAATHAEARLSEPLQPALVVLVAGALVHLMRRVRRASDGADAP